MSRCLCLQTSNIARQDRNSCHASPALGAPRALADDLVGAGRGSARELRAGRPATGVGPAPPFVCGCVAGAGHFLAPMWLLRGAQRTCPAQPPFSLCCRLLGNPTPPSVLYPAAQPPKGRRPRSSWNVVPGLPLAGNLFFVVRCNCHIVPTVAAHQFLTRSSQPANHAPPSLILTPMLGCAPHEQQPSAPMPSPCMHGTDPAGTA